MTTEVKQSGYGKNGGVRLVSNLAVLGIGVSAANFVANILIARLLGPGGMGIFQVAISSTTVATTVFSLGLGDATIYSWGKNESDRGGIAWFVKRYTIAAAGTVGAIVTLMIATGAGFFGNLDWGTSFIFGSSAAAGLAVLLLRPLALAQLKAKLAGVAVFIGWCVYLLSLLILMWSGIRNVAAAAFVYAGGGIIATLILWYGTAGGWTRNFGVVRKIIGRGLSFAPLNLVVLIYTQASILLLNGLATRTDLGHAEIGIYSRAVALTGLITVIPVAVAGLLFSRWARTDSEAIRQQCALAVRIIWPTAAVIALTLIMSKAQLMAILFGEDYVTGARYVVPLALGNAMYAIIIVLRSFLVGRGGYWFWTLINGVALVIMSVVLYSSFATLGFMSGPAAILVGNAVLLCSAVYGAYKQGVGLRQAAIPRRSDLTYVLQGIRS